MNDCVFCQIIADKLPSSPVYQDDHCQAFLDIQPVNPGHLLVVPNIHVASLAELPPALAGHLFQVAQRTAAALRESGLRCEGINIMLADGEVAGQDVFHFHLHVIPRFSGDGFGFTFDPAYFQPPERSLLDQVAEKIRRAF